MDNQEIKMVTYCELCIEQFSATGNNVPRILNCGHTFCECCLNKLRVPYSGKKSLYYNGHKICCPKCKSETVLSSPLSVTADLLPKNFSYLDLIEAVLEKEEVSSANKRETCNEHPDYVLDMFCHNEEEAVCLKCTVYGQHSTHQVSKLSDFADQRKTAIESNTSCLNNMIDGCKELKEQLEERRSHVEEKFVEIRQEICDRFSLVQEKLKTCLDEKLEKILDELDQMKAVQNAIFDTNLEIDLDVEELEELRDESDEFLAHASQSDIAKEKELNTNVNLCLEKVRNHELIMTYKYEVKIEDANHMLEVITDLVGSWTLTMSETKEASTESIGSLQEKYSDEYFNDSLHVLFGEEQPSDELCQNPFDGIGCKWSNIHVDEEQPQDELGEVSKNTYFSKRQGKRKKKNKGKRRK